MDTSVEVLDFYQLSVKSKIDFWNKLSQSETGKKYRRLQIYVFTYGLYILSTDPLKTVNDKHHRPRKVKKIIASIEKSGENVVNIHNDASTQNTKKNKRTMSDVINSLLYIKLRLRHDLPHFNWPSRIMASTTMDSIACSNVNIMEDSKKYYYL
jgi:hypothetical protein